VLLHVGIDTPRRQTRCSLWAYDHPVQIDFSRPARPTDNSFVEGFTGSLRAECLNIHWFATIDGAKAKIEAWRVDYNESRPHQSLNNMTPAAFVDHNSDLTHPIPPRTELPGMPWRRLAKSGNMFSTPRQYVVLGTLFCVELQMCGNTDPDVRRRETAALRARSGAAVAYP